MWFDYCEGEGIGMEPNREKLLSMYRTMVQIRSFELRVMDLFARDRLPGFLHPVVGQEAVPVGTCANLREDDYVVSTHRGHGDVIAKGARLDLMMAELFGRTTGYCRGKGGSMHIASFALGILGANGIVGGGIPIANGAGLREFSREPQLGCCVGATRDLCLLQQSIRRHNSD